MGIKPETLTRFDVMKSCPENDDVHEAMYLTG